MKKKLLTVLVALAVLLALAVPNVLAVPYKDPGVSISESIDIQFPWDAETLVKGDSNTYDLNLAIGAGALCAAVESGTAVAEDALGDLSLAGTVAHYGYGANTSSVAHTIALQPISVDGNDYNLITVVGRGSMSLTDIMTDISPGAFSQNADVVLTNLKGFLADNGLTLNDPANRFFVTGHSLGGAVANIVAHRLATENGVLRTAIYGYTYASPWTANKTDSDAGVDKNIFNLVGGSTVLSQAFDNFCWGSDETFGNLLNGSYNLFEFASKRRYGTDKVFDNQDNAFKAAYEALTGIAYDANGTLAKHLVTTYLAYILADQTLAVSVEDGIRTVAINGGALPTEPVTEPTEPVTEPTEPVTEPTEPVTEPTEPVTEPTEPVTEPTEPVTEPTEPVTEPTEPVTEPTQPVTEPTQPVTEPTQPVTEPTQPVTEPTKPSGGSSGGGIFGFFTSIVKSITSIFRSIFRW